MKDRAAVLHMRNAVDAGLSRAISNDQALWYSAVLRTLNWVLLLDKDLPIMGKLTE